MTEMKHNPDIHPTAAIGDNAVIHPGAVIGANAVIGAGAVVYPAARVGAGCVIGDHAVVGRPPVLGAASTAKAADADAPLTLGENVRVGAHAVICCDTEIATGAIIGDFALVRERVRIGEGSLAGSFAVVENDVTIGAHVKIMTRAYITALTTIGDHAFIAPCVITTNDNFMGRTEERFKYKGGARIGRGARVGAGAVLLPNVNIGDEAFVAAASVVTRDVPAATLVMGAPAKPVRPVPEKEKIPPE